MTRLDAAILSLTLILWPQVAPQEPATFRSRATAVSVDVSVRQGNRPVAGLSAGDFILTDQGVKQEISLAEASNLPVDVTLLIDVSGSTADSHRRYEAEAARVARLLGPDDRLRFVTFGTSVWEPMPMSEPAEKLLMRPFQSGGATSLYDALATALMQPTPPERRAVAVVFTDGEDTFSVLPVEMVERLAARADVALHIWLTPPSRRTVSTSSAHGPLRIIDVGGGSDASRAPGWIAPIGDARERLLELANVTGGGRLGSGMLSGSIAGAVEKVLSDFRKRYVLRYQPAGVPEGGWHDISVTVTQPGNYRVSARKGYWGGR